MRIPGKRLKKTRLIQTENYVVAVDVEMVIPPKIRVNRAMNPKQFNFSET
jgi:hypothetical protein